MRHEGGGGWPGRRLTRPEHSHQSQRGGGARVAPRAAAPEASSSGEAAGASSGGVRAAGGDRAAHGVGFELVLDPIVPQMAVQLVEGVGPAPAVFQASSPVVEYIASSPMDGACNSGGTGGLLPVQRSTSYCLDVCSWSPTRGKGTKGGVPDRQTICYLSQRWRQEKIFGRPAVHGGRLQVHFPGGNQAQVPGGALTPSLHAEVPGTQYVSPGRGLGIKQSMGWTKVCGTARSGIWVLKGNARARMQPDNLDHLRVRWIPRGTYETAWVTPLHDRLCSYRYGHGAAIRPQTNDAIWNGVTGFVGQGRTPLVTLVCKGEYANGGEPEPVRWSKIAHSLAQRQRALVRPTIRPSS